MRSASLLSLALTVQLAAACAASPSSGPAAGTTARRDPTVITEEQLLDARFESVYDAVRLLKAQWLIERNLDDLTSTNPTMVVYLDDARMGGLEALRDIQAKTAAYVRYIDGPRAMARWGRGHERGVILVATRKDFVPAE